MTPHASDPMEHVLDQPWTLDGRTVPWMSSHIAAMILVGLGCLAALPLLARRRGMVPKGPYHVLELFVVFVREWVAKPALGPLADQFIPFLSTLLLFLLGINLTGLVPLPSILSLMGVTATPVGGTATGSLYVCGGLAALTLLIVLASGYWRAVRILWKGNGHAVHAAGHGHGAQADDRAALAGHVVDQGGVVMVPGRRWPLPVAIVLGLPVWINGFVPPMPGMIGIILWPFLLVLEIFSLISRMFALCIRLFANMTAGHLLLFVVIGFAAAGRGWAIAYISVPSGLASMLLMGMELFTAIVQAYIFTFLTAIFMGMVIAPQH